jgi:tRNA(adenine34) deaminase
MVSEKPSEVWMQRCLQLAQEAKERGEAAVGAVIVHEGVLLAEACEQVKTLIDVTAHAELIAIRQACQVSGARDLTDCILYTNVEPCWMCSFAIRETGISQVVISASVPDIGGVTSTYPILTDANINGWRTPPIINWELDRAVPGEASGSEGRSPA